MEGISNIETIRCDLESAGKSKLKDDYLDLVILANALFQSQKKPEIISEAKRTLKPNGQLLIIEWEKEKILSPKEGWLISKEIAADLAEEQGFKFVKEIDVDQEHFGLLFSKM